MNAIEMVALTTALDDAFAQMSESDVDRMLKEQNADIRVLMSSVV